MKRSLSLRFILTGAILGLTLVSLFAAVSLITVTTSLHRVSRSLNQSVESVRLTEEAEIALLVHARLRDPLARAQSEASVRRNLEDAQSFVGTEKEAQVLRESTSAVEAYFSATSKRPPDAEELAIRLESAFRTVGRLAEINVVQSQDARREARRLNDLAEVISFVGLIVLIVIVPLLVWWLNTQAFRPSVSLARAMTQISGGDWSARAPETGPRELREMARHFNQMVDELAHRREAQATFLAGVAHDLRTPLAALKLSAEAVPPEQPLPSEGRIRKTMAVVARQADRLERMVNDFLDSAQIEAGELTLSIENHDLRELARNVVNLFSDTSPQHRLVLDLPDDPVWVACDAGRMDQVLNNLMSNAIKYAPDGGEIRIAVERRDEGVDLSVTDRGLGISADEQTQLFQPFRRARGTQGIPGVGVGLFVCRRLVEAHGGSIDVESAPGKGSTFSVWLPLSSRADEERATDARVRDASAGGA